MTYLEAREAADALCEGTEEVRRFWRDGTHWVCEIAMRVPIVTNRHGVRIAVPELLVDGREIVGYGYVAHREVTVGWASGASSCA